MRDHAYSVKCSTQLKDDVSILYENIIEKYKHIRRLKAMVKI